MGFSIGFKRAVVIGNSGSGKSTLAAAIAEAGNRPHIDLDRIHWLPGSYSTQREAASARRMAIEAASAERWVIEGVYGWLAAIALERATHLLWLNLPWQECEEGLLHRGPSAGAPAGAFGDLLPWAREYYARENAPSQRGHQKLFDSFAGEKLEIRNRADANTLMRRLEDHAPS